MTVCGAVMLGPTKVKMNPLKLLLNETNNTLWMPKIYHCFQGEGLDLLSHLTENHPSGN